MSGGVRVIVRLWTTPKPDAPDGRENEDRFWLSGYRPGAEEKGPLTLALADGASGSLFAREWARALCAAASATAVLDEAASAAALVWRRGTAAKRLPWYLEARRAAGAAATLLRVAVSPAGSWEAQAVGDTCLLHRRGDRLLTAFPRSRPDDFGSAPELIHARPESVVVPRVETARGEGRPGDTLCLMTDALAAWFLREAEAGGTAPWRWLEGIRDDADFRSRIATLRGDGRLRGDDTTLIEVRLSEL